MAIVSISLGEDDLSEIDGFRKEYGFSGRSEVIRAGMRALIADKREQAKIKGKIDAILIIMHDEKYSQEISEIEHQFQSIIKTQIHNCIEKHKCLETFVLQGDAQKIKKMLEEFETSKKAEIVKLVVA